MKTVLNWILFFFKLAVKAFKLIFYYLYSRVMRMLLEQQVKRAVRLSKLENRRYIVTTFFGRPRCYSKQMLKEAIRRRKFKKGVTIEQIEKQAYFVTTTGKNITPQPMRVKGGTK